MRFWAGFGPPFLFLGDAMGIYIVVAMLGAAWLIFTA